jgi:hypothetical protein
MINYVVFNKSSGEIEYLNSLASEFDFAGLDDGYDFIRVDSEIIDFDSTYVLNGQLASRIKRPSYNHNWINGSWVLDIASLKSAKLLEITKNCADAITGGFKSSATGTLYQYPSTQVDQLNLNSFVLNSSNTQSSTPLGEYLWCADENNVWNYTYHTSAQMYQVCEDCRLHISSQRLKNATLQNLIEIAQTEEDINSITWSNV